MADNYIENLLENYPNFLLAIDRIIRLEPRRINQHENPQEKHNIPNEQFQVVIPRHIPHIPNKQSQQYRDPKSKKNASEIHLSLKKHNPMILNLMTPKKNSKMI